MKKLNDIYKYGCKLILVSIDEGITGYRDDSLEVGLISFLCYPHVYSEFDINS